MKTLVLIRHAKSSWEPHFTDVLRPLSPRGINDAKLLSNEVLKLRFLPDAIYSSPATRALTTCNLFMEDLNLSSSLLTVVDELYDFDGDKVRNFIYNLNDSYETVLIFGHNYAFTAVANAFGDKNIDNIPTCGFVMIEFNTDSWKKINTGHTKSTLFPKDLKY